MAGSKEELSRRSHNVRVGRERGKRRVLACRAHQGSGKCRGSPSPPRLRRSCTAHTHPHPYLGPVGGWAGLRQATIPLPPPAQCQGCSSASRTLRAPPHLLSHSPKSSSSPWQSEQAAGASGQRWGRPWGRACSGAPLAPPLPPGTAPVLCHHHHQIPYPLNKSLCPPPQLWGVPEGSLAAMRVPLPPGAHWLPQCQGCTLGRKCGVGM